MVRGTEISYEELAAIRIKPPHFEKWDFSPSKTMPE